MSEEDAIGSRPKSTNICSREFRRRRINESTDEEKQDASPDAENRVSPVAGGPAVCVVRSPLPLVRVALRSQLQVVKSEV